MGNMENINFYEFLNEQMLNNEYEKELEIAWLKKFKENFSKVKKYNKYIFL